MHSAAIIGCGVFTKCIIKQCLHFFAPFGDFLEWAHLEADDEDESQRASLEILRDEDVDYASGSEGKVCLDFSLADLQKSGLKLS